METKGTLNIVHFNDVYNVFPREGDEVCGGISRFSTLLQSLAGSNPLILFSGDLWSPSKLSSIFDGEQLLESFNHLGVRVACLGNHDLDLGLEQSEKLIKATNFPWLLTNMTLKDGTRPAGTQEYEIVEHEGWRIGVIGIAEYDWIATLTCLDFEDIDYYEFCETAETYGKMLKEEEHCDLVIALTHMRLNNDRKVLKNTTTIDLFLGGHDHCYVHEKHNENLILKSGTNFFNLSTLSLTLNPTQTPANAPNEPTHPINDQNVQTGKEYTYSLKNNKFTAKITKLDITQKILPDPKIEEYLAFYASQMEAKMNIVIGFIDKPVDTAFSKVRTAENEFGNFLTDLMRKEYDTDCAILNSGNIRADKLYGKGPLKAADIYDLIALTVPVVVLQLKGADLYDLLENAVSKYPALEGRFAHYSGLNFCFDAELPPGARIDAGEVYVKGQKLDLERDYTVATAQYISTGKDGFTAFLKGTVLIDEENALNLKQIILKFFKLFEKEEHLKEKELIEAHHEVFTKEFVRKSARRKMHSALTKMGVFINSSKKLTPSPRKKRRVRVEEESVGKNNSLSVEPRKRVDLVCKKSIENFIEAERSPSSVVVSRIFKYKLVNSIVKHEGKWLIGISPKIENRVVVKNGITQ